METSLFTGKSLNVLVLVGVNSLELVVDFRSNHPSHPPPLIIQRLRVIRAESQILMGTTIQEDLKWNICTITSGGK